MWTDFKVVFRVNVSVNTEEEEEEDSERRMYVKGQFKLYMF